MNDQQQQQFLINEPPIPLRRNNDIHIIEQEEDLDREEAHQNATEDGRLEDALEAWQEINSLVRNIGRSLIKREVSVLKRSAHEITQRASNNAAIVGTGSTTNNSTEQSRHCSSSSEAPGSSPASNKRRRVSGFDEDTNPSKPQQQQQQQQSVVHASEQEALVRRMNRMRQMNAILVSINSSHGQLEEVIRDMMQDEPQEDQAL